MAQDKGRFEVYDLDNFKLHVYYTNDALGDASYIIEGTQELVTMEQPLFRDNVAEFDRYLASLGKPVVRRITDYHVGGTGDHATVMAEGMPGVYERRNLRRHDAGIRRNLRQCAGRPSHRFGQVKPPSAPPIHGPAFPSGSNAVPPPTFPEQAS